MGLIASLLAATTLLSAEAGPPASLRDAAAQVAIHVACDGSVRCRSRESTRLIEAARTIVDVCLSEERIPRWVCLAVTVAVASESRGLEHPTCGRLDQRCARACDRGPTGRARQSCYLQCALDQGVRRGSRRWRRVANCNDAGTSRGPLQLKPKIVRACRRALDDPDFDAHDLASSTRCYLRRLRRLHDRDPYPCPSGAGNRWAIQLKRCGRGPTRTIREARGRWVETTTGPPVWVKATEERTVQVCTESAYARRGLLAYQNCGDACHTD